jgi:mannose-6-phosphate isomerase-like protein (cupin superfamily)
MPVVHPSATVQFANIEGTQIVGLASPSRGSVELSAWRLRLEPGISSPPHALDHEEVFVVLAGRVRMTCGATVEEAEAGGALIAPVGTEFTLDNPGAEPFEAIACASAAIRATVAGETFAPPWAA